MPALRNPLSWLKTQRIRNVSFSILHGTGTVFTVYLHKKFKNAAIYSTISHNFWDIKGMLKSYVMIKRVRGCVINHYRGKGEGQNAGKKRYVTYGRSLNYDSRSSVKFQVSYDLSNQFKLVN